MDKTTYDLILRHKLIAIVRGVDTATLLPLCEALYAGGVRLLELTFSQGSDTETANRIALLCERFTGRMRIGAGTVLTQKQVALVHGAGGDFIISPSVSQAVIEKTRELGLVSIPGALTPTEVVQAHTYGADLVKLFPVSSLGADYVKALRAPLAHIPLLAVGGVTPKNVGDFLRAGAAGVGIGSDLTPKDALACGDFDAVTRRAAEYTLAIDAYRTGG